MNLFAAILSELKVNPTTTTSETTPTERLQKLLKSFKECALSIGIIGIDTQIRDSLKSQTLPPFLNQLIPQVSHGSTGSRDTSVLAYYLDQCHGLLTELQSKDRTASDLRSLTPKEAQNLETILIQTIIGLTKAAATASPPPPAREEAKILKAKEGQIIASVDIDLANSTKRGEKAERFIALGMLLNNKSHINIESLENYPALQRIIKLATNTDAECGTLLNYLYECKNPYLKQEVITQAEQQAIQLVNSADTPLTRKLRQELALATTLIGNLGGAVGQPYLEAVGEALLMHLGEQAQVEVKVTINGDGAQAAFIVTGSELTAGEINRRVDLIVKATRAEMLRKVYTSLKGTVADALGLPSGDLDSFKKLVSELWPQIMGETCGYEHLRVICSSMAIDDSREGQILAKQFPSIGISGHNASGTSPHHILALDLPSMGPQALTNLAKRQTRNTQPRDTVYPFQGQIFTDPQSIEIKEHELGWSIEHIRHSIARINPRATYVANSENRVPGARTEIESSQYDSPKGALESLLEKKNALNAFYKDQFQSYTTQLTDTYQPDYNSLRNRFISIMTPLESLIEAEKNQRNIDAALDNIRHIVPLLEKNLDIQSLENELGGYLIILKGILEIYHGKSTQDQAKPAEQATQANNSDGENEPHLQTNYYRITVMLPVACNDRKLTIYENNNLQAWIKETFANNDTSGISFRQIDRILNNFNNQFQTTTIQDVMDLIKYTSDYPDNFSDKVIESFLGIAGDIVKDYIGDISAKHLPSFWTEQFAASVPIGKLEMLRAVSEGYLRFSIPANTTLTKEALAEIKEYFVITQGLEYDPDNTHVSIEEAYSSVIICNGNAGLQIVPLVITPDGRVIPSYLHAANEMKAWKRRAPTNANGNLQQVVVAAN